MHAQGRTAAVIVEPLQGEGGINAATPAFLATLRQACDKAGALLIFDEVQCGLGRTGQMWGHSHFDVEPDMMSLAKPLAGRCLVMTQSTCNCCCVLPGGEQLRDGVHEGGRLLPFPCLSILMRR